MKHNLISSFSARKHKAVILIAALFSTILLAACAHQTKTQDETDLLWANATYTQDTTLGSGKNTCMLSVLVGEHKTAFTIKTDKTNLAEALLENDLIAGEEGAYGLYVKTVNGMLADYDQNQSYWAFYIDDEMAMVGVDATEIIEGETYKLEYTK